MVFEIVFKIVFGNIRVLIFRPFRYAMDREEEKRQLARAVDMMCWLWLDGGRGWLVTDRVSQVRRQ